MTAELAKEGCELLAQFAHLHKQQGDPEKAAHITKRVLAIESLIAHATEMQAVFKAKDRPDNPGYWIRRKPVFRDDASLMGHISDVYLFNAAEIEHDPAKKRESLEWYGPMPLALTETPRPATTGEGMGEK